ncbi:MAG: hypothetical protein NVS3B26_02160 [Mycobacteriales bacterium]
MNEFSSAPLATVLIVDDEPTNRKLLETLLQSDGYRTTTAATGELALVSVAEDRPDLILLDVMMPGMDGYEVAGTLKADAATANIPIIIVSALDDRGARIHGLRAGAEEFLTKPVDKGELWLRVRNLLRLKELSDRLQGHSSALEMQVRARTADLHQLAHYDALTGLPNRAFLYENLRKTLPLAAQKGWTVAVMFVDIDHFKTVNDTLGHAVGDDLLAQFSARLLAGVRVRDSVGRLGGDEFALIVLLEHANREGAAVVARKIGDALQAPFELGEHQTRISASIGISLYPDDGEDADTLLRTADAAMYRAKEAGRDTFRFFTSNMNEDASVRIQGEAATRARAASNDALAIGLLDDMDAPTCAVDGTGLITAVNRAWRDVPSSGAAVPSGIDIGASYLDALAAGEPSEAVQLGVPLRQLLAHERDRFELRYSLGNDDEKREFNLVAFRLPDGKGAVLCHVDVTSGLVMNEAPWLGVRDPLTGLPGRQELLDVLVDGLSSDDEVLAVACFGVDRLKAVNDSYGFEAGDELLKVITDRAKQHLRHGDTLARVAGDEFVVIWQQVSSMAEATELAARLATVFAAPFELAAATVSMSASVGVSLGSAPQTGPDLLLAANSAMRDAKRRGPGRTAFHTHAHKEATSTRIRLEAEIRSGMARGEFVLHYQPIVDLQQRVVTGVEALVRWNHPAGMRMPDEFIPIAEQSGLIVPLGAWILNEACRQAAAWSAAGVDLIMAVNLSVRQVTDPLLLSVLEAALATAPLTPERLLLEITESAVIEDAELALATLLSVHSLGVGIAIDDFGTGYGSLLYLKRYPVHTLKIDRAFVAGIGVNVDDHAIVATVVGLGRAVGAACTAEGVETLEQADALRELGCAYAQGYFFARPVPANDLPGILKECDLRLQLPLLISSCHSRTRHVVPPSVVQRATELHRRGSSLHTIAAALNSEGSSGPGAVRWSSSTVARVLDANATSASVKARAV